MATAGHTMRNTQKDLSIATGGLAARGAFCARHTGQDQPPSPALPSASGSLSASAWASRPVGAAGTAPRLARPALAALEALLLLVIVGAALALLVGQAESARDNLRQDLAGRQLSLLREALAVYYLETGAFPPGRPDAIGRDAFKALQSRPACAAVLHDWPQPPPDAPDAAPHDAWRSAYRYIAPENDLSQQVAANGGWPFFLSAGPDADFGDQANPASEVDNRRTDELLAGGGG